MSTTPTTNRTFDSLNPRTGDVVDTHPVHSADDVHAALVRARTAGTWWSALSFGERKKVLKAWKGVITRRIEQLAHLIHQETGKTHGDAVLEIALAIEHLDWAASKAEKVLGRRRVSAGLLMMNQQATVEYQPFGVIGVIGPWNYPVFTPMGSIAYALAAGNAVVFKPSEFTPGVGVWLANSLAEVADQPVLQVVTGRGETGAALCRSGVDKVAFTGSPATGRKVMAACAETLTPVVIEGGGKDAVIVDQDADIKAAADAAVWGACANAGQTCAGVERVYVHERVYDAFVDRVVAIASSVRAGTDSAAQVGPITMPSQVGVVRRHIAAALADGGRALLGGEVDPDTNVVQPTVLVDVPEHSVAVQEETFGPTMTITRVRTVEEAITLANRSRYGLGATVFAKARGMEIAARIRSGMASVNGVVAFAGVAALPFGGVGESGFGRIHGADGLREFTYSKAITRQRFKAPLALTTFARTEKAVHRLTQLLTMLHGTGTTLRTQRRVG